MSNSRKSYRSDEPSSDDHPQYSRLFIVGDRNLEEKDYREAFAEYGTIEDIRIPRNHNTGEPKGVIYIKFAKTSEAAVALEDMHLRKLPNSNRPMKVMVAANRSDIQPECGDDEKYRRLFITIPKTATEEGLREYFKIFGRVESIIIQRDRDTQESKGFAYVKYRLFSEAATAFEEADPKYRTIFATPKTLKKRETQFESNINSLASSTSCVKNSLTSMMNVQPGNYTRVRAMCSPFLTQFHVEKLFDIIPGMLHCVYIVDLLQDHGKAVVTYSNSMSAAYAIQKLNNFEFPPGQRIFVKPDTGNEPTLPNEPKDMTSVINKLKSAIGVATSDTPNLVQLADAIAQASKIIKTVTTGMSNVPDSNELSYCNVKLPDPKPLAPIDSPIAKRCFLVCKPQPPAVTILRDIFCRFGDLINVYTLPNKTVGYACYASEQGADEAMARLHGAEVCGIRMKVIEAEEKEDPNERSNKRKKYDD